MHPLLVRGEHFLRADLLLPREPRRIALCPSGPPQMVAAPVQLVGVLPRDVVMDMRRVLNLLELNEIRLLLWGGRQSCLLLVRAPLNLLEAVHLAGPWRLWTSSMLLI